MIVKITGRVQWGKSKSVAFSRVSKIVSICCVVFIPERSNEKNSLKAEFSNNLENTRKSYELKSNVASVLINCIIKNTYKYILIDNVLYIVFFFSFFRDLFSNPAQTRIYFQFASGLVFRESKGNKLPL